MAIDGSSIAFEAELVVQGYCTMFSGNQTVGRSRYDLKSWPGISNKDVLLCCKQVSSKLKLGASRELRANQVGLSP